MNKERETDSTIDYIDQEKEEEGEYFNESENKYLVEQNGLESNHNESEDVFTNIITAVVEQNGLESNQNDSEDAFTDIITAATYLFNGSPGAAAKYYGNAHRKFQTLKGIEGKRIYGFYADYSEAMKLATEGAQDIALGNLNEAKTLFQRAHFLFSEINNNLPTLLDKDEDEFQYEFLQNCLSFGPYVCDSYYSLAEAREQFSRGNYLDASEFFYETAENYRQMIEHLNRNEIFKPLINLYSGEYYNYLGNSYLAEGEALREQEKWDEALKRYAEVRKTWKQATQSYIQSYMESGFPQGLLMQVYLTNEISKISELYIKRCKVDQEQKTRIKQLEDQIKTMIDSISKSGVTVNTFNDANSAIEQNIEIIQKLETNVKENIQNLLDKLDSTSVPDKYKEQIRDKAEELVGSEKKGNQFLKSVKEFTEDLKTIVSNIGETAKPLMPFVAALSILI